MEVGDIITVPTARYERAGSDSYPNGFVIGPEVQLRITRLTEARVIARGAINSGTEASVWVWRSQVETVNGVVPATGERPRPLGTKPEDSPDIPFYYIDVSDPGIQWLFEDMAKFADNKDWCRQYDDLARTLGIPGRPQTYTAVAHRGGTQIMAAMTAHSQEQANAALAAMLIPAE